MYRWIAIGLLAVGVTAAGCYAGIRHAEQALSHPSLASIEPSHSFGSKVPGVAVVQARTRGATGHAHSIPGTAQAVRWQEPTGGTYPKLYKGESLTVEVSISRQRAYIKSGHRTLYTMAVSTGLLQKGDETPLGTYHIQPERGRTFYNDTLEEGANYWVSWKGHGVYLFHSVPIDETGHYKVAEADKLGQPASHGCVRLSVSDAKWFYEHIPEGTTVIIHS